MAERINTLEWVPYGEGRQAGDVHAMRVVQGAMQMHDHVFHEIVYVETGTGEHYSAEGTRRLSPGDLIVIRPQVWHGYGNTRNLTIINCLFHKRIMQRLNPILEDIDGAFELFRKPAGRTHREPPAVLHVRPAQRPAIVEPLEQILAEQQTRSNGWQASCAAALLEILVTIARLVRHQLPAPAAQESGRTTRAVFDTVAYLEATFDQPARLDELADRVGLSPAHLSRSFSRQMGMGIVEFVHRLRCEEACRLLRCTNDPIARIATRVGYDEIAYFSRCFRQHVGQSPRRYRQETRTVGRAA
jgi:AraC family L-rhamnose operon transcriptional activator RhaR